MTDTAQKIMELFAKHDKVKAGMVLTFPELSHKAKEWGPQHSEGFEEAMAELRDEGYVLITAPHGLELTEKGFSYLFADL
jgi:hypothetical protein